MPAFAAKMNDNEIWAVTSYLRTVSFDLSAQTVQVPSPTTGSSSTSVPTGNPTLAATNLTDTASPDSTPGGTETTVATQAISATPEQSTTPEGLKASVTGQITNGSGGKIPNQATITLHGFVNMNETLTQETQVKADGSYQFNDVPLQEGIAFIISTEVEGTSYNSDVVAYDGTTTSFVLPLTIYDNTTDTSSITADRLHIFFDFTNPGLVQVIQIYILSNSSNKAVIASGSDQAVQTYILPEGASNLQFDSGEIGNPYIKTKNGFGDPTSILPGASSYQLLYAFDMPYGKNLEIKQPINVAVGSVIVMVPDGVKAKSAQLKDGGVKDVQGKTYSMYTAEKLSPGDSLDLTISGTPSGKSTSSAPTNNTQTNLVIGISIFGGVLILAGIFFFLRGRSHKEDLDEEPDDDEIDSLGEDADQLMDAIASLDDQYKAGALNEAAYQKRRTELKTRLKELL